MLFYIGICGLSTIALASFLLYKVLKSDRQLNPSLLKVVHYFSVVLNKSKMRVAARNNLAIVSNLDNYSKTMKLWSEESASDSDTDNTIDEGIDDDDGDPDSCNSVANTSVKPIRPSFQSVGSQTENRLGQNWRLENANVPLHSGFIEVLVDRNTIRRIQSQQLQRQVRYLTERDLKTPLIICVEANSTNISGYLLNLREKVCKFYVYGIDNLPWEHETSPAEWDNTEFKMKNMVFALLLWEQEILLIKKFSLFANCWAVNHADCIFGKLATDFVEHFTSCENIIRVNSNSQISRYRDTSVFARLIQPAGELIHWNLHRFRQFIKNSYGIVQFEGSHSFLDDYSESSKDDGYFARSSRYHYFLSKVNRNSEKWVAGCRKCDVRFSKYVDYKKQLSSDSASSESEILPYPLGDDYW